MYEGFLFDRIANVSIGKPGETGKLFENIRIKFNIVKNSESTSNQSTIELYNLSSASRGFLEKEKELICILKAGYQGIDIGGKILDTIFIGDILLISNEKKQTDIITKLECGDSQKKLTETHVEQTFAKGTKIEKVVDFVIRKFGLSIGKFVPLSKSEFPNGLSISGNAKDILDRIMKREGKEWHIQDEKIIIDDSNIKNPEEAIVLSKDTGLIGIPIVREKGLEVISLLQPSIKPGKTIQIISTVKNGFFKVREAIYEGDTYEGKWEIKVIVE